MADIRINSLPTTAASTASDDFVAVDGSANGTRKLNAYSPTFGGNLTVNGTGTSSFSGDVSFPNDKGIYSAVSNGRLFLSGDSTGNGAFIQLTGTGHAAPSRVRIDATSGIISNLANTKNTTWDVDQNWGIAGNLTVSGTGTSSVAGLLDLSAATAGQIKFPASQNSSANANTLDDYEEGTWTPTDQSGASLSFTVYNAVYTKVGRLVEIQAAIYYPSTVSSASALIGGLPFNAADGDDNTGGICLSATNVNLNFTGLIARNNNRFFLETIAGSSVINSNMSAKYIKFFGWYYV